MQQFTKKLWRGKLTVAVLHCIGYNTLLFLKDKSQIVFFFRQLQKIVQDIKKNDSGFLNKLRR